MNRLQAINKIKKAYETKQLGFQKGATSCLYYDKSSDSCCAVGVLVRKDKKLLNPQGDRNAVFRAGLDANSYTIESQMRAVNKSSFHGLDIDELRKIQKLHDEVVQTRGCGEERRNEKEISFKEYLYALKA